ncbi:Mrp/NBP35 family ATP-binding protein [candidate division WOR-3 bacterium]|nr:Mrp/NBP35 family ATP-binding protein [candidate division WOR-3 bacterium]
MNTSKQKNTAEERQRQQAELNHKIQKNLEKIKHKLLVLSNKGGVGKSFVAVNLAACLSEDNAKIGILDADIHGPSIAKMMGFEGKKPVATSEGLTPMLVKPNLWAFSMASLLNSPDVPVIWRGPLKGIALKQFIGEVNWGKLDYLIVDSPPGTGDEPLSICQLIPELNGGIIVTTPQAIALSDSRKCVNFLRQLKIPILGIVENMSGFICPYCKKEINLFKVGGGEKSAKELNVPFLGRIPIDVNIVETSDSGTLFIKNFPDSSASKAFKEIVAKIRDNIQPRTYA